MKSKMRLSLLACALGAATIATAQTSNDASPPNDVVRSLGSVATPIMPVEVSPPRDDTVGTAAENGNSRQALPVVRSIGSDNNASDQALGDTMIDGAATGAVVTPNSGRKAGVVSSGSSHPHDRPRSRLGPGPTARAVGPADARARRMDAVWRRLSSRTCRRDPRRYGCARSRRTSSRL